MHLSKSRYCSLWQCPKILWLKKHKPAEMMIDSQTLARFDAGTEVGKLACELFGDYVSVDFNKDIQKMVEQTQRYILDGKEVICEATFSYNNMICSVDILKKNGDKYDLFEVKSSTDLDYIYLVDIAYQKYVLEHAGIALSSVNLVHINNQYIRKGEVDVSQLFTIKSVDHLISEEYSKIEENIKSAELIVDGEVEPLIDISEKCHKPYDCFFYKYCSKHLPIPSVFDLYRMNKTKQYDLYNRGIVSYEDLWKKNAANNEKQFRQIEHHLKVLPDHIDKKGIENFLKTLSYPLYFLDFETVQDVIPKHDNTKPYQQIPFQYSLHYIEKEGGELKHKEFLAEPEEDPRRKIAEQLCNDIPVHACVLAYYKAFECSRISELAELFPDLQKHLMLINFNIKDLLDPFQSGHYYTKAMGGSFSIKSVLPALFPNDKDLDYKQLNLVHNGSDAMALYPAMKNMTKEQREETRNALLAYCKLDTLAMVKIWQKLKETI
jgi:hypothetical protein